MYKSFAFTVRPKFGVDENSALERKLIKYIEKYQGFLVSEKEGLERHLHGQIFYEKPKPKGRFNEQLESICKTTTDNWSPDQSRVLRAGTKIAYSDSYFTEYTNKGGVLLISNMPLSTTDYYPTEEEQDKVQRRANAVDQKYHRLSELYAEYSESIPTLGKIKQFLFDIMFVSKKYHVVEDPKKRKWLADCLLEYILADPDRWDLALKLEIKKYKDIYICPTASADTDAAPPELKETSDTSSEEKELAHSNCS